MATEIRNVSVDPLTLPNPLQGALKGGQAIVLSYATSDLLGLIPSVGQTFQLTDLGAAYSGPTDDSQYGLVAAASFTSVTVNDTNTKRVTGALDNLLLRPAAGGGYVAITKADGSTLAFQSNATGTAVNGATPVARASAITSPTAPGASYVQAEAAAMKTAVDAIRVAIANFGITS